MRWFADLAPMTQIVVREHARHHRLADRHRADADARIVAALGDDLGLVAVAVDGLARRQDRRGRLDGEARDDRLPGRDAAEDAARVVGQEDRPAVIAHAHLVGVLLAGQRGRRKAVADLDALDRIDAHQRGRELGIELAVDRRAPAGRDVFGDDLDHGADRGAALADVVEVLARTSQRCRRRARRTDFRSTCVPVPARAIDLVRPDLDQRAAHHHAGHDLARDRAGRDPRRGLARRLPPAAAIVAQAVLGVIGVVGVAGAIECRGCPNNPSSAGRRSRSAARSACRW